AHEGGARGADPPQLLPLLQTASRRCAAAQRLGAADHGAAPWRSDATARLVIFAARGRVLRDAACPRRGRAGACRVAPRLADRAPSLQSAAARPADSGSRFA